MSLPFLPLTPEDEIIVIEALKFAKQKILYYHSDWLSDSPRVLHADIDRKRANYHKAINNVLELIEKTELQNKLFRRSALTNFNELIASSLSIYAREYKKAQDPKLPSSRTKYLKISQLLNGARFGNQHSTLWDEFYIGYKSGIKKNGKLIFFSYSSKERNIIGEIADRLQSNYGYEVFRAHDRESIDNDEDWRIKIKENLEKCDGLVAYVTLKFRRSAWTQQEVGWVMARDIPIYSLFSMKKIPGFLEAKQGTRIKGPMDYDKISNDIHDFFERYYKRVGSV